MVLLLFVYLFLFFILYQEIICLSMHNRIHLNFIDLIIIFNLMLIILLSYAALYSLNMLLFMKFIVVFMPRVELTFNIELFVLFFYSTGILFLGVL